MKLFLSLALAALFSNLVFSQTKTEVQVGLYPKGRYIYVNKRAFPTQGGSEFLFHFKPGILIRHQNNAIIIKYSHSLGWSELAELPLMRSFHLSYRRYLVKEFSRYKWSKQVTLFAEIENVFQDWVFDSSEPSGVLPLDGFMAYNFSPMLGFELYFYKKLKIEIAYGYKVFTRYKNHPDLFFAIMYRI